MSVPPAPSAMDLLDAWERGYSQSHPRRALTLLAAGGSGPSIESLARLSIGRRDAQLLRLRERTFGSRMTAVDQCPGCRERVEFSFTTADIATDAIEGDVPARDLEDPVERTESIIAGGCELEFRCVNTDDLMQTAAETDTATATRRLIERCIVKVRRGELNDAAIQAVVDRMAELDAAADIRLAVVCPACEKRWSAAFDIVSFYWAEIDAWARRTLLDVHALAAAYGWDEAAILQLSVWRRECYLRLVRG